MPAGITNWDIINRCEVWLGHIIEEKCVMPCAEANEVVSALFNIADLALCDMKFLAQMEDAGLGHGAGPQVRRLLEASTVAWDMQTHCDESIARATKDAWAARRGFTSKQVSESRKRMKGENGKVAQSVQSFWENYNSESHFNLCQRMLPAGGAQCVKDGIAMGYLIIHALALFRSQYLPTECRAEGTRDAEIRLYEAGCTLLNR